MRALIVGCGYIGLPLCLELARQGHTVFGVSRTGTARDTLKAAGVTALSADISRAAEVATLPNDCDWLVDCVASSGGTPEDYAQVYREGMRNLLNRFALPRLGKLVYTSSTSVYSQNDGSWIDEQSPAEPDSETGRVLRETEEVLMEAVRTRAFPGVILRLAGIYGPGRGYWLQQYLQGTARLERETRWLNMVHRDDVVGATIRTLHSASPGQIYNVADDEPVTQRALFEWLSTRLGRPLPEVGKELPVRKRGASNKRILNQKLKTELGYRFKFPTFREGFEAELSR